MSRKDQIAHEAAALSQDQQEATLAFMRALKRNPFFGSAPPEALQALDRGLAEIVAGEVVPGPAVFERLDKKLKAKGA